jgi:hypothetical protein
MMKIENHCNCCDLPCIDCGRKRVEVYYCDKCGEELVEDVYEDEDKHYCDQCLLDKYRKEF